MNSTKNTDSIQRVFISHSSHDKDTAHKILHFLESQGRQCWIAPRDIPPGAGWTESIMEGLSYSSVIVLIISKSVNDSPHVRREVEYAVSSKIPIIPILLEDILISKWLEYCISSHQWMYFSKGGWDDNLQLLWSTLSQEKHSLPPTLKGDCRKRKFPLLKRVIRFIKKRANHERKINPKKRIQIIKSALIGFMIGFVNFLVPIFYLSYHMADDFMTGKENILDIVPNALPYSLLCGGIHALMAVIVVKVWVSKYSLARTFLVTTALSFVPFQVFSLLSSSFAYQTLVTPFLIPISCFIGMVAVFNKYVVVRWMVKYSVRNIQILGTILSYLFIQSLLIYKYGLSSIIDNSSPGGDFFLSIGSYLFMTTPILYIPCSLVGTISAIAKIGVDKWTAVSE